MIKNFGRQFITSLTITALLFPSFISAETLPQSPADPSEALFGDYTGSGATGATIPNANTTAPATTIPNLPSLTPPASSQKSAAQRLADSRKDDRRQCEAEVSGSGAGTIGQLIGNEVGDTLKGALYDELGKALPQSVNNILNNDLAPQVADGLRQELPSIVTTGLKQEFPGQLMLNIQEELDLNSTLTLDGIVHDQGRFTALIRESIDESLPRIITDGLHDRLPNIIDGSLAIVIPHSLNLEFSKLAKPTIENHFRAQIDSLVAGIPQLITQQIQALQATIQGTVNGIQAVIRGAASSPITLVTDAVGFLLNIISGRSLQDSVNAIPEVAQIKALATNLLAQIEATTEFIKWAGDLITHKDQLVENLVNGFSVSLTQSLTNPKAVARLADAIGSAITDPINNSLDNAVDRIASSIEGPINNAIAGVNAIPNLFFDPINRALDDVSALVDLELNMVVNAITDPITAVIDSVSESIATTIDSTLEGVLYAPIAGVQDLAGGAGNAIADGIRSTAVQAHVALFGDTYTAIDPEGNFQPVLPNGPDSYFPPIETPAILGAGELVGPVMQVPSDFVGPLAPGEVYAPTSPLADASLELADVAAEETIASSETVVASSLPAESGGVLTSSLDASLLGATTGLFGAGISAAFAGIPGGQFLASMAQKVFTDLLAGTAFGAAAAAIAVPVTEIGALLAVNQSTDSTTGKILQSSEQIKAMTEKIYSLQVQACTHLKVIQRVQLALETKEFLNDPNARKANAEVLYKTQLEFVTNFLNQGREISDGMTGVATAGVDNNKGPLIIRNLTDHIAEAGREANFVFQDNLRQLEGDTENYPNAKIIREALIAQDNHDPLRGTLTKTQIDKFRDDPQSLSNDEFWSTFQALGQPENNIYGQTLIAQGLRDERVAAAQAAALAEYEAGDGYAGTRECIAMTANGYCAKWQTLTPGSTIGGYSDRLAQAAIEQAAASDELIEDSTKSEVSSSAKRIENLSNLSQTVPKFSETAKQSVLAQPTDPCPGPGPCPQTGWPKNSARPSGSGGGSSSGGGSGGLSPANFQPLIPEPPSAAFGLSPTNPTVAEVVAGAKNQTVIRWSASNATACKANNDWPTGQVGTNIRTASQSVGLSGEVTIENPIRFRAPPIFSRITSMTGLVGTIRITGPEPTTNRLTERVIFNPVNAGGIHPDDVYRLTLQTLTGPINLDVGGVGANPAATAAGVVKLFRDRIEIAQEENNALGRELRRYASPAVHLDEVAGTGWLVLSPSLLYQLTCTRGEQRIDKEIPLYRQP
ncbi:MAG TPA: hypothetical protein VJB69_02020 [Candidatus Paceibacterota bacterium]